MVKYVRLHIEGGRNKTEDVEMRRGFHQFFRELFEQGRSSYVSLTFVLHGDRRSTRDAFRHRLSADPDTYHVLLVDSEEPIGDYGACWKHVKTRPADKWPRPKGTRDDQCQLMVKAIESWLFTDPKSLKDYYGQEFLVNSLPKTTDVEDIPKDSHIHALEAATRHTQKGPYHKRRHLPDILARIDPRKVRQRAPHCERIFATIGARIESGDWG